MGDDGISHLLSVNFDEAEKIKEYWIILNSQMHNVQKDHTTDMLLENLKVDTGVSSSKFSERMMKRGIK